MFQHYHFGKIAIILNSLIVKERILEINLFGNCYIVNLQYVIPYLAIKL